MAKREESAKVKVAYDLSRAAKHKLSMLKADLRLQGVPATETGIIEALLDATDLKKLAPVYRRFLEG